MTPHEVPRGSLLFFKESEDGIITTSSVAQVKSRVWEGITCEYQFILVRLKGTWESPVTGSRFNK